MSKAKTTAESVKQTTLPAVTVARWALGAYMLVFLLGQLFTFEKFPELLQSIGIGSALSVALAVLLVCLELMSMPFLIGVSVRRSVIRLSRACCFLALGLLGFAEVLAFMSGGSILLGATFDVPGGAWSLLLVLSLWILLVWSSGVLDRFSNKSTR